MNPAIRQEIIAHLRAQLADAENWVARNAKFPDAAKAWEEKAAQFRAWIAELQNNP